MIVPISILYFLYPSSFEGQWEGSWTGRFLYLFFLWLVLLECILAWEKLGRKVRIGTMRRIASVCLSLLPSVFVVVSYFTDLKTILTNIAAQNNVYHANLWYLPIEYFVFCILFSMILLVCYGIDILAEFSISGLFLGIVGLLYLTDIMYPMGRFTPFQILVPPTAHLAANFLNFIGYRTIWYGVFGGMPVFSAVNSVGHSSPPFAIAWPCSGVESLFIYTIVILLFLKKAEMPSWQKVAYFGIGAVITYFINVLRIVSIYVIAISGGDWVRFHDIYGELYSLTWIMLYPLLIVGTRVFWRRITNRVDKRIADPLEQLSTNSRHIESNT